MSVDVSSVAPGGTRRAIPSGYGYQGRHRSPHFTDVCRPGSLVLEAAGSAPSTVVRQIDAVTALVRHVGTCDDHPAAIRDLVPFAEAAQRSGPVEDPRGGQ
jgi:hypothetical protein